MGEHAEMVLEGIFCETCGDFLDADPAGHPEQCDDCFEEEMREAVEADEWPDGMQYAEWSQYKYMYSFPEFRE